MNVIRLCRCFIHSMSFIFIFVLSMVLSVRIGRIDNTTFKAFLFGATLLNLTCEECTCAAWRISAVGWNYFLSNGICEMIQNYSSSDIGLQEMPNGTFLFQYLPPYPPSTPPRETITSATSMNTITETETSTTSIVVLSLFATGSVANYYSALGTLAAQMAAILDPNPSATYYSSGGFAPQYVQLQLSSASTISAVCLQIAQSPSGTTHHQLFVGPSVNSTQLVNDLNGYTYSGQWINITYSPPLTNVRFLVLNTLSSPSWVAWVKFLVYGP